MLGDVLLITDNHRKAAGQIVGRLAAIEIARPVIAVGGESGSGKSELAHVIARRLKDQGKLAKVLHSDNYYRVTPRERTKWRQEHGPASIGLAEYDWDLIVKNILEFREGSRAILPCIDLLTDQEDQLITDFSGVSVLIVEGLYSLGVDADLKVVIDLTYLDTKKAQVVRGKEPVNEYRRLVLEQEHLAVQSLRPMADLLVTREFEVIKA